MENRLGIFLGFGPDGLDDGESTAGAGLLDCRARRTKGGGDGALVLVGELVFAGHGWICSVRAELKDQDPQSSNRQWPKSFQSAGFSRSANLDTGACTLVSAKLLQLRLGETGHWRAGSVP